jgi:hypothetical protein
MCRWFAYISPTEPCLLSDVLITPDNSISKQCSEHYLPHLLPHNEEKDLDDSPDELMRMRNSLLNMDGLGIACTCHIVSLYHHMAFLVYNIIIHVYLVVTKIKARYLQKAQGLESQKRQRYKNTQVPENC